MASDKAKKSLMTHLVIGYPSIEANRRAIKAMSDAGADFIELQIPFSDPIADGRTILHANQAALNNNISVADCFSFAGEMAETYSGINFLFMTYYNIIFSAGAERFVKKSKAEGLYGLIVPDVPPEEDREGFFPACRKTGIHPICVISPTTGNERLKMISSLASGFIYCTSRVGTTGAGKKPHEHLAKYIADAGKIINLPVAVGFGIDSPQRAKMISVFADIIVIGSKVINIIDESGKKFEKNVYRFLYDVKKAIS